MSLSFIYHRLHYTGHTLIQIPAQQNQVAECNRGADVSVDVRVGKQLLRREGKDSSTRGALPRFSNALCTVPDFPPGTGRRHESSVVTERIQTLPGKNKTRCHGNRARLAEVLKSRSAGKSCFFTALDRVVLHRRQEDV